jgi:cytochrome b561
MTAESYDRTTIRLHWATAFLVCWQWGQAHLIDLVTAGGTPGRRAMVGLHVLGGLLLLAVLLARLAWRHRGGIRLAHAAGWEGLAARAGHLALYALLAAVVGLGLWLEWVRGDNLFGLVQVPAFDPGNRALRRAAGDWHELAANALLVLAGLHALVALAHHYIRRDGVLRRMLPGLK